MDSLENMFNANAMVSENDGVQKVRCSGPVCLRYFLQSCGAYREEDSQKRIQDMYEQLGWVQNRYLTLVDMQILLQKLKGNVLESDAAALGVDSETQEQVENTDTKTGNCSTGSAKSDDSAARSDVVQATSKSHSSTGVGSELSHPEWYPPFNYVVRNGFIDNESEPVAMRFSKLVAMLSTESIAEIWSRVASTCSQHKRLLPMFNL